MHEVEHGLKTWKCETKRLTSYFASQAVFAGIFAGVKKWPGNKPTLIVKVVTQFLTSLCHHSVSWLWWV